MQIIHGQKYYFSWFTYNGKVFCQRWNSEVPNHNDPIEGTQVQLSMEEFYLPLSDLERKYPYKG